MLLNCSFINFFFIFDCFNLFLYLNIKYQNFVNQLLNVYFNYYYFESHHICSHWSLNEYFLDKFNLASTLLIYCLNQSFHSIAYLLILIWTNFYFLLYFHFNFMHLIKFTFGDFLFQNFIFDLELIFEKRLFNFHIKEKECFTDSSLFHFDY